MRACVGTIASSILFGALLGQAAKAEDSWALVGYGVYTCANYLAEESNALDKAILGQWVWGFWSGLNAEKLLNRQCYRSLSVFRDELQAAEAVLGECSAKPEDQIAVAALAVYERLGLASLE